MSEIDLVHLCSVGTARTVVTELAIAMRLITLYSVCEWNLLTEPGCNVH